MRARTVFALALGLCAGGLAAQETAPLPPLALAPAPAATAPTDIPTSSPLAPSDRPSVVILDWHTFLGNKSSGLDFSDQDLAAQLDEIVSLGYRFVSLEDAIAGRIEGRANVVFTCDDGNHSIYEAYRDVLKPRGIVPTFFVYPAIILGKVRYAISAERLRELRDSGCEIGAHGYFHMPLSEKAFAKSERDSLTEIRKPGPALERILGSAPKIFAYPYGVSSRQAEEALRKEGYEWAFAADDFVHTVAFSDPGLDHLSVPRTIVYHYNYKLILKALAERLKG